MKGLPEGFDPDELVPALVAGWALEPTSTDYLPIGFGSYHWEVRDRGGRRWFVTIDDLDDKPWLGAARRAAFDGLGRAFGTTYALAAECGLAFVVPPVLTREGEPVRRVDDRYALSVHPLLDGVAGHFGDELAVDERRELVGVLADLHAAQPRSVVPRVDAPLPGRSDLVAAMRESRTPWSGGPYAEPARAWLREHATALGHQLAVFDALAGALEGADLVVTHGEPHPGNVLRVAGRPMLIDWDTVALAPRERDLFMVDDEGLEEYVPASGHVPDRDRLALYRLAWDLGDVATYLTLFRAPHDDGADTQDCWSYLSGSTWLDDAAGGPPPT